MQKGWYDDVPEDRLHKELKSETLNKPHEHINLKVQQSALPPLINFAPLVPPLNCLRKVWTEIEMWQEGFKIETHAAKFETWVPMRSVFFVDFCNGPNFIRAEKKMRKNNLYLKTETNLCRVASSFFLVQHYSSPSENFAWKHNGGNQLQKSDKSQIFYWSSQTALRSGSRLIDRWIDGWNVNHAQKPENGPISDLFNLTQNTFCPYCLILT